MSILTSAIARSAAVASLLSVSVAVPATAENVVIYTADGLEGYYEKVLPAFESALGGRVAKVTGGSGAVVNRLEIQKDSPKADILITLPPFMQLAAEKGLITPYVSKEDSAIPAANKGKDGIYYVMMNNYFSFIHNPNVTKTPPKTFDDLLKPEFKGKIAYSNPLTAGDGMGVVILLDKLMGEDKAFAFMEKLEPSVKFHTKGTGALDVMVSRGEIEIANGDMQMDVADELQGGLSIEPFFLSVDGKTPATFQLPYYIALVKNGPNPEGGKKLIDYLLSNQAQEQNVAFFGLPARSDVELSGKNGALLKKLLDGVTVETIDWNMVIKKQPEWEKKWKQSVLNASISDN